MTCPKCQAVSGDDWSQCGSSCPMSGSPVYSRIQQVRYAREFSIQEAKRAVAIADERFEGDLRLGGWFVHASALAVHVPFDRPGWNEAYARRRVAEEDALAPAS